VKMQREQGSSSLAFVLLIFSLGMLMLSGLQQQLDRQRFAVAREIGFLKEYTAAVSALAWGSKQHWQKANQWQCKREAAQWRACVLMTTKDKVVMAAQGVSQQKSAPVTLWRWGKVANTQWISSSHGWADFCPLTEASQCQLPE